MGIRVLMDIWDWYQEIDGDLGWGSKYLRISGMEIWELLWIKSCVKLDYLYKIELRKGLCL